MTQQRTVTKTPRNATGLFAAFRGLLRGHGSGAPALARAALLATLAAVGILGLIPGVAGAEIFHPFVTGLTGAGTPAKAFRPAAVAVDDSTNALDESAGDLYVVDEDHQDVVDKLNAAGGFECQITGLPGSMAAPSSECDSGDFTRKGVEGGSFTEGVSSIAVDSATGDLYIAIAGAGIVDEFGPEGAYLSHINGLSYPIAVAVDAASGDVYIIQVAEEGSGAAKVSRYEPGTASLTTFAEGTTEGTTTVPFGSLGGLAVDNDSSSSSFGDVYVVDRGNNVVDKFNKTGGYEGQLSGTPEGPFLSVTGVAVDPSSGDVYVGDQGEVDAGGNQVRTAVDQFDASGTFVGRISGSQTPEYLGSPASIRPNSIAIAPTGDVYTENPKFEEVVDVFGPGVLIPDVKTEGVSAVTATTATAAGTVNAEGVALTRCEFEYGATEAYGQTAACIPAASSITGEQAVTAHLIGLEGGTTYHFRLRATNGDGYPSFGKDESFPTLPVPSIESAVAKNVTGESALLEASIDPNGHPVTSCEFEYGTTTAYGTPVACPQPVGEGTSAVTETLQLKGLAQGKTYHWRIVASEANGTAHASSYDHTFVYDTSGGGLPDGRAYELVTPAHKDGALFGDLLFGFPAEIANNGSRVIASAIQCFGVAESCLIVNNGSFVGTPNSFTRTSTGWQTTAFNPPEVRYPVSNVIGAYNANTGLALFSFHGEGSSESSFLLRGAEGYSTEIGPSPGDVNVGHFVHTEDYSHFAFLSGSALLEYVGAGTSWQLFPVGVSGGLGSTDLISACRTTSGGEQGEQGAMSADGSIVYFTALKCASGSGVNHETSVPANTLYARVDGEQADAHTVPISTRSLSDCTGECATSAPANAAFWGASQDGSKVFFTSGQQLTNQATPKQENLYESDCAGCEYLSAAEEHAKRRLLDVSEGAPGAEVVGGPRVQGVTAISADGSHVYFVAQGVLTTAERPGCSAEWQAAGRISEADCHAVDGADNLYVYDTETSRTSFIVTLAASDEFEWSARLGGLSAVAHLANVTPDGRFLVFRSPGQLSADDTSRSGSRQVFRYDAQSGELLRVSIGNDGFNDNGNRSTPTPCNAEERCTEDASIVQPLNRPRRDPTMSDNGEYVFFQSPVGLTPQALDDAPIGIEDEETPGVGSHNTIYAQNVYEWHQGHVYLISDGRDVSKDKGQSAYCGVASSVCLLGTDATGADVFFTTADQLVPQDIDTELDIYDARIGGGFPASAVSPPCLGEECHGIPAGTPAAPSAPTATFNGQGNIAPVAPAVKKKTVKCKKVVVKKKGKKKTECLKKSKKRAKKSAHTNRRPSR